MLDSSAIVRSLAVRYSVIIVFLFLSCLYVRNEFATVGKFGKKIAALMSLTQLTGGHKYQSSDIWC